MKPEVFPTIHLIHWAKLLSYFDLKCKGKGKLRRSHGDGVRLFYKQEHDNSPWGKRPADGVLYSPKSPYPGISAATLQT